MTIKQALFALESVAHLQGRERMLLPIVDAAREEHAELLRCLQALVDNIDSDAIGLQPQLTAAKAIIERSSSSAEVEAV
jgi:hypothetical protein